MLFRLNGIEIFPRRKKVKCSVGKVGCAYYMAIELSTGCVRQLSNVYSLNDLLKSKPMLVNVSKSQSALARSIGYL